MGCDIHSGVEVKVPRYDASAEDNFREKWVAVKGDYFPYPYHYPEMPLGPAGSTSSWNDGNPDRGNAPFSNRNYFMFALLADVRNSGGVVPIDDPRGAPRAMAKWTDKHTLSHEHSTSWLSLKELEKVVAPGGLAHQQITVTGVVSAEKADAYLLSGIVPTSWAGDIWSQSSVTVEHDAYVADPRHKLDGKNVNVRLRWTENLWEYVGSEFEIAMPVLRKLCPREGTLEWEQRQTIRRGQAEDTRPLALNKLRVVFDFDS